MASKRKAKLKVVGLEPLLKKFPIPEQAELKEIVQDAFKDMDPNQPIGEPVTALADGSTICPECCHPLIPLSTFQLPPRVGGTLAGKLVTMMECDRCDKPYMVRAKN